MWFDIWVEIPKSIILRAEFEIGYLVVQMDRKSIMRELRIPLEHGPDVLQ